MTYEATFMLYGYKAVPIGQFESKELAAKQLLTISLRTLAYIDQG